MFNIAHNNFIITDDEFDRMLNSQEGVDLKPQKYVPKNSSYSGNYFCYHLHSDLSNGVTNIDSVTKFKEYVDAAKECGMKALAFSEHGSVFEWYHKKKAIEEAGMKYVHASEVYLTETLDDKIRDNYHCVLIARNYDGFKELNRLISRSFNRKDNHYYYVPRISFEELFQTSDNIIITTACIGGVFGKGSIETQDQFLRFMSSNSGRCFFEIGHHMDEKQKEYNQYILSLSKDYGIPLIAGTDTHALDSVQAEGRRILQLSKNIHFDGEDSWDLTFHDYDSLVDAYRKQNVLDESVYLDAIENTNLLANMVEEFELDKSTKYPKIYDNSEEAFRSKIESARQNHKYINDRYSKEELDAVIDTEFEVYKKTQSIDFMLLQSYIREWEKDNGIQCGYGRGSVSGSMIAYILGITEMDSIRFNLNFFRFMNPSRVTNADIDTDYSSEDRDAVKQFILRDHINLDNIRSSEIITFNTIALKGAIRDIGRALQIPLDEVGEICKQCDDKEVPESLRKKYPELFRFVDIVNGTIVSIGTHPSGCLVSDLEIEEMIGMCSTSTSEYQVSMLNMKELDDLMYVKLDILGLANIGVINKTCKMLGIDRLGPDNVDLEDMDVWRSIRDDTTLIFQWESNSAQAYIKQFMSDKTIETARSNNPNFSMVEWLSFGNGLIRPGCASFRDDVASGHKLVTGFKELDDALSATSGRITMQEDIMKFLVKFCGYSDAESDTVRRGIAKKSGTEKFIDEIHDRFVSYSHENFGQSIELLEEVFVPIKQGILDATRYSFSYNHSQAYSIIGYVCGYLRYHYPLEFLTAALNIFRDDAEKTAEITKYAKRVGIKVISPKFGNSGNEYTYSKDENVIAKGVSSVKYMGKSTGETLLNLSKEKNYILFSDLLCDIRLQTDIDTRQVDSLIKIDFFKDFGNQRELIAICDMCELFKYGNAKQIKKSAAESSAFAEIIRSNSNGLTKNGEEAKNYVFINLPEIMKQCEMLIKSIGLEDLSDILKIKNFADIMGYSGYVSNKESDRRKLYVKDIFPIKRKKDGKQFGYNIITQSVGSGVESKFTVFNRVYDRDPIKKDDVILCTGWEREGQYFTLTSYSHLYA